MNCGGRRYKISNLKLSNYLNYLILVYNVQIILANTSMNVHKVVWQQI